MRHERAELMLGQARYHLAQGRFAEAAATLRRAVAELDEAAVGRADDRARAVSLLTPGELRTARMAVDGMKNREIADALRVSVKAVEFHLANAYRKLGVVGRAGLSGAIA